MAEVVGQLHVLGEGKLLLRAIREDRVPSMILWGPPGSGKTTLATVIAGETRAHFESFSAVLGSVPELREILARARERRLFEGRRTLLFVDEIHRFNRAQQDALLPAVEKGEVTLIGATTENPSFAVIAALLSRAKVFRLLPLGPDELSTLLERALADRERGLGELGLRLGEGTSAAIAGLAAGDARRALGVLEAAALFAKSARPDADAVLVDDVAASAEERPLLYDKAGDQHYDHASAFIKSLRGTDPDAALYWMFRMLDAGEDPLFVSRRMIIFASEDIGNADPRALGLALDADGAFRRLGMPEGLYPLSHACLYLAAAPKSDSVKVAMGRARGLIDETGALPVPTKLRNAPTRLMKEQGFGEGYRYAHDHPGHHVPGETYLPDALVGAVVFTPTTEGFERHIHERLLRLRGRGEGDE